MLIDEFGLHPLALEDAAPRPATSEGGRVQGIPAAGDLRRDLPAQDARELQTTEVDLFIGRNYVVDHPPRPRPRARRGADALDARRADAARGGRLPRLCGARRDHRLLRPLHQRHRGRDRRDRNRRAHPVGRGGRDEPAPAQAGHRRPAPRAVPAALGLPGLAAARSPLLPGQHGGTISARCFDHVLRILDDAGRASATSAASALEASLAINARTGSTRR